MRIFGSIFTRGIPKLFFDRDVRHMVWNLYPYLSIFLPQKTADLMWVFFFFFSKFVQIGNVNLLNCHSNQIWIIYAWKKLIVKR